MSFQSQRSNIVLRASMSPLVKPSLMPVKTSPGSDVGSPFGSPALSYKMGAVDVKSAWHGPVQSPHIMRRGPKLWTSVSGRDSSTALEPHSHKCSGLVNGELHCEDWSDSSQFFWRCCIIFFFPCRSADEWFPPWTLPTALCCKSWQRGSAAEIYLHMASEQARTGGVKLQCIGGAVPVWKNLPLYGIYTFFSAYLI